MAAKKYAKALFEIMKRDDLLGTLKNEMYDIRDIVKEKSSHDYLANGSVPRKDKMEAFLVCHSLTKGFLNVVMDHKQEKELYDISKECIDLMNQQLGEADVEVTSGIELSEAEKEKLKAKLAFHLGKKVNLSYKIDSGIIGGLIVRCGSSVIDVSVKGALNGMYKSITGV